MGIRERALENLGVIMNDEEFQADNDVQIDAMARDLDFQAITRRWFDRSFDHRYSYHFRWMGLPIIQYPQDIVAMQELIWRIRPDVIIETGVARGGSIVFYASLLKLLDRGGRVIGIDIDIRRHNREAIEAHPMAAVWIHNEHLPIKVEKHIEDGITCWQ